MEQALSCCGFVSTDERFSRAWSMAHRAFHLAKYPDTDPITRNNLDMLVKRAPRA